MPKLEVEIDGKILKIRQNLARFLYSLRSHAKPIYVWADAICIDQGSVQEKIHQVQQMKEVYTRSRATRVWLGELSSTVVDLFKSAKLQYAQWHFPSHLFGQDMFSGLREIVENPYWVDYGSCKKLYYLLRFKYVWGRKTCRGPTLFRYAKRLQHEWRRQIAPLMGWSRSCLEGTYSN
jgi:hypothetical protein